MTEGPPHPHGVKTVLVLDDEETIRRTVQRILELHDFNVLVAESAHEAQEVVEDHEGRLDLLLCDLVLPELGGREAANLLRARIPDLKVLYMSGYSSRHSFRGELEEAGEPFLAKPFDVVGLVDAVRSAIGD